MPKSKLPSCLTGAIPRYEGSRIDLYTVNHREAVIHPGAVIILPLLSATDVILIRNERFVVDDTLWELPAGTLEPGESPLETASREVIEETGYRSTRLAPLLEFYTTPGFCNEKMYAFVANDLEFVGQQLDETEKITAEPLSWEKIMEMIRQGVIKDGKTIAVLLYYHFASKT